MEGVEVTVVPVRVPEAGRQSRGRRNRHAGQGQGRHAGALPHMVAHVGREQRSQRVVQRPVAVAFLRHVVVRFRREEVGVPSGEDGASG